MIARALCVIAAMTSVAAADDFDAARATLTTNDVAVYSYSADYIGKPGGHFAPMIKTADGGFLAIGTTTDIPKGQPYKDGHSAPTVLKLDKAGAITWRKDYKVAKGFKDYEGGALVATPDGNYVIYVLAYVNPAIGSVGRFVKIDGTGKILWQLQLRGNGTAGTPFPDEEVLEKDGSITLTGHIYKENKTEVTYDWTGKIDKTGKLVVDKVGAKQTKS